MLRMVLSSTFYIIINILLFFFFFYTWELLVSSIILSNQNPEQLWKSLLNKLFEIYVLQICVCKSNCHLIRPVMREGKVCFLINHEKGNIQLQDLHTLCFVSLVLSLTVHNIFGLIDFLRYIVTKINYADNYPLTI